MQDALPKVCAKTGALCSGRCNGNSHLQLEIPRALQTIPWYQPTTLDSLYKLMAGPLNDQKVFYVSGHTSVGVYNDGPWDCEVDLKKIPDLFTKTVADGKAVVGAGVTLTDLIEFFLSSSTKEGFQYLAVLAAHIKKIANVPVRNVCREIHPVFIFRIRLMIVIFKI